MFRHRRAAHCLSERLLTRPPADRTPAGTAAHLRAAGSLRAEPRPALVTGTSDGPGARRGPARRDSQQAFPVGGFPVCPVGFAVSTQRSSAVLTSLMHRFRKICFQMQNVGLLAGSSQREESVRSKTEHLCKIRARRTRSWPGQLCSELSFSADPFLGTSCSPWRPLAGVPGMDRWRPRRL